jgi:hypothetical protein
MGEHEKKILFILASNEYIRNYITTGAFDTLAGRYRCGYLVSDNVTLRDKIGDVSGAIDSFKTVRKYEKLHYTFFNVLMWRYRDKSSAFYFRFLRSIEIDRLRWRGDLRSFLLNAARFLYSNLVRNRVALKCFLFGNRLLFNSYLKRYERRVPVNQDLREKIRKANPDLVVFPSSAYDPIGNDIVRICRPLGIKTLFLIDNWDNLSSKTIFWTKPDYLGVWGQQSKEHAITIHGFDERRVFNIGTPRFDGYYEARKKSLVSHFDFPYVLFAGCSLGFDELWPLRALEEEIERNRAIYGDLKVVYRPHPWREPRFVNDRFEQDRFKHVVLDPQMKPVFTAGGGGRLGTFQPDLSYYPVLLKQAVFVVGPLTTMLVEALLFYRRVLALAYNDGLHLTSPHNAYKYYPHFRGIEDLRLVTLCFDKEKLAETFRRLFGEPQRIDTSEADRQILYFIYSDRRGYKSRLLDMVAHVLGDEERREGPIARPAGNR